MVVITDDIECNSKIENCFEKENTLGKGENAWYQLFFLCPTFLSQKVSSLTMSEPCKEFRHFKMACYLPIDVSSPIPPSIFFFNDTNSISNTQYRNIGPI